ncbi:hypothetical protein LEP1GSC047_2266 [Leptospira inadai serovar Lyme str. 10]|uniref:Uncharacterized protein n=2 Tax=Leptospira inadai serovar Lyme TaxID=293084 RepID=V6HE91_9LEPT|nr:hypothetical protein LEP1GSC047_2266 [Leptospira inadai serovar Lyme str. 10]PNV72246.1 hypothetical protein BES34_019835 [Leptospira inadai serovar Lyme]
MLSFWSNVPVRKTSRPISEIIDRIEFGNEAIQNSEILKYKKSSLRRSLFASRHSEKMNIRLKISARVFRTRKSH